MGQIRVMILGAGKGGTALLDLLSQLPHIQIVGIADTNPYAPGIHKANQLQVPVSSQVASLLAQNEVDLIVDVTGDPKVATLLEKRAHPTGEVLTGSTAKLLWDLIGYEQRLESNLLQAEKLASIGTFVSSIAHDINNPLYVILGLAQHLTEELEHSSHRESALDIVDAAKRIAKTCQGLTLYSRKPPAENLGPVNLNIQLEEALNIAYFATNHKGIFVKKNYGSTPLIEADQDEILQVLVNLVINAMHAMEGKGTLTLYSECQNGTVTLRITDTGCGIPKTHLSSIFTPFFTTKPPGIGTGLGLYSAKSITEKYGGQICVYSDVNKGTTFALQFPTMTSA